MIDKGLLPLLPDWYQHSTVLPEPGLEQGHIPCQHSTGDPCMVGNLDHLLLPHVLF